MDLQYWTSKVEYLVAFAAIFSNICTAHAQKRLFMNIQCKFRHRFSIPRPRFFYNSAKFRRLSDVFRWFFFAFYMLNVRRFSTSGLFGPLPRKLTPTAIISTKFEFNMSIHCRVIAFLLLTRYVTSWPWSVIMHGKSRSQPCHLGWRPCAYSFLRYEL